MPVVSRSLVAMAVCGLTLMGAVPLLAQPADHPRQDAWILGAALGGGNVDIDIEDQPKPEDKSGFGLGFHFGRGFNPEWVGSVEVNNLWVTVENETQLFSLWSGAASWYPQALWGFYLRGGVGLARGEFRIPDPLPGAETFSESGVGFMAALGYEWWTGEQYTLGPQVDFVWMTLDPTVTVSFLTVSLAFTYYIP